MKIEELISSIEREEIVVPEFQREFVWNDLEQGINLLTFE